ncbi:hypothetical protein ES703_112604 [subsurface metagenome]
MTAGKERRALDKAVTSWRRVVSGQRQSIRRPQQALPAARREEEASGEAHTSPA